MMGIGHWALGIGTRLWRELLVIGYWLLGKGVDSSDDFKKGVAKQRLPQFHIPHSSFLIGPNNTYQNTQHSTLNAQRSFSSKGCR